MEHEYPDFHILHIADGRVIGITRDCIVVYESIDDVYEGGLKDRPMIDLIQEE
jgi:hypothetical protein